MRKVGEIKDRDHARRFATFLGAEKITAEIREDEGTFSVWVLDEDRLDAAAAHFAAFSATPDDARFSPRGAPAPVEEGAPKPTRRTPGGGTVYTVGSMSAGTATVVLIGLSLLATMISMAPGTAYLARWLYFSEYYGHSFPEISDGQVWRFITPIFLHGGWLHLIFNMLWLFQLGGAIEIVEGKLRFLAFTLGLAILCNTTQYVVSGPNFVGMSGVVYGLLGYMWMMSRHQAGSRYVMPQQTVYVMVIWMVVCIAGIIPNVANAEHVSGFVLGTGWGFLRSGAIGAAKRRKKYRERL